MPLGAAHQTSVNTRVRSGVPGMLVDVDGDRAIDVLINKDPQAAEVWTLLIDTATDAETYGVNQTDPVVVSTSFLSGAGTTKILIAAGLQDAWNAAPQARASALAVSDGVATVTYTGVFEGLPITIAEDENAAKMTLTNTTSADEADPVPFGRAMISTAYQSSEPDQLGVIAKASALTAQVDTWTITYDAGIEISAIIEIDGETYESVPFAMATNLATVTAALDVAIDAVMPANTVIATNTATTVVATAEVAGKPFKSTLRFGVGATTAAGVKVTNQATPSTDFNKVFAGISVWTTDEQQLSLTTEVAQYAPNAGVEVLRRGDMWVESSASPVNGAPVYVELDGTSADVGKFFTATSATRVLVNSAVWKRPDFTGSDGGCAHLRIDLPA